MCRHVRAPARGTRRLLGAAGRVLVACAPFAWRPCVQAHARPHTRAPTHTRAYTHTRPHTHAPTHARAAGELLHVAEPFLEKNLHPTVIVKGYGQVWRRARMLCAWVRVWACGQARGCRSELGKGGVGAVWLLQPPCCCLTRTRSHAHAHTHPLPWPTRWR